MGSTGNGQTGEWEGFLTGVGAGTRGRKTFASVGFCRFGFCCIRKCENCDAKVEEGREEVEWLGCSA